LPKKEGASNWTEGKGDNNEFNKPGWECHIINGQGGVGQNKKTELKQTSSEGS